MKFLYNRVNGEILREKLAKNRENRITLSFYKYHCLRNPEFFRDHLYILMNQLGVLGRIYVAREGINAQISLPAHQLEAFKKELEGIDFLRDVRLNFAIKDDGKSFFKLKIKTRNKIVADGISDDGFDATRSGRRLNAMEFNSLASLRDTVIVDMRNHYESEVGHFQGALLPGANTFREILLNAKKMLEPYREKNIILYCTGGIRCEKASAYFRHLGYPKVYQLDGGIIHYAREVETHQLENHFIGKNFVFDERMGERITEHIIARCHQCGKPCDQHTNCRNAECNLLFIQCDECHQKMEGCCSEACREVIHLSPGEQKTKRKGRYSGLKIYSANAEAFSLLNASNENH